MDIPRFPAGRAIATFALLAFIDSAALLAQDGVEEVARRAATAKVRPGDRIAVHFMRDQALNAAVSVNERGEAVFPKLGAIPVSHLTIGEFPDSLRQRYREYLREPEMDVAVLRRVVVNGEVKAPGIYYLEITSGVREAIAGAGGVLETANKGSVVIVRDATRIPVKGWDRQQGPGMDLLSGDQVVVGRKQWLVLNALPVISTSVIVIGLIRSLRN